MSLDEVEVVKGYHSMALSNHKIIMENEKPPKFRYFDRWEYKRTKLFLDEINNKIPKTYKTYSRGTLIKVDYGINIGCEISNIHFGIVLSKFDNAFSQALNVVPIYSKYSNGKVDLESCIFEQLISSTEKDVDTLRNMITGYDKESENNVISLKELEKRIKILEENLEYYKIYTGTSYTDITQIRLVSKERILHSKNEYDLICKYKVDSKLLDIIEQNIVEKFCK